MLRFYIICFPELTLSFVLTIPAAGATAAYLNTQIYNRAKSQSPMRKFFGKAEFSSSSESGESQEVPPEALSQKAEQRYFFKNPLRHQVHPVAIVPDPFDGKLLLKKSRSFPIKLSSQALFPQSKSVHFVEETGKSKTIKGYPKSPIPEAEILSSLYSTSSIEPDITTEEVTQKVRDSLAKIFDPDDNDNEGSLLKQRESSELLMSIYEKVSELLQCTMKKIETDNCDNFRNEIFRALEIILSRLNKLETKNVTSRFHKDRGESARSKELEHTIERLKVELSTEKEKFSVEHSERLREQVSHEKFQALTLRSISDLEETAAIKKRESLEAFAEIEELKRKSEEDQKLILEYRRDFEMRKKQLESDESCRALEMNELETQLYEARAGIEEAKGEIEELIHIHERDMSKVMAQITDFERTNLHLKQSNTACNEELTNSKSRLAHLQMQMQTATKTVGQLKRELTILQTRESQKADEFEEHRRSNQIAIESLKWVIQAMSDVVIPLLQEKSAEHFLLVFHDFARLLLLRQPHIQTVRMISAFFTEAICGLTQLHAQSEKRRHQDVVSHLDFQREVMGVLSRFARQVGTRVPTRRGKRRFKRRIAKSEE